MTRKQTEAEKTLRRARKLISKPENWTKNEYAITKNGYRLGPDLLMKTDSDQIASYCSFGAVYKANGPGELRAKHLLRKALMESIGSGDVIDFNDRLTTGHKDVLRMFDEAIKLARKDDDR